MILRLLGVGEQIHCKNECWYSKVVKFIVKTYIFEEGIKNIWTRPLGALEVQLLCICGGQTESQSEVSIWSFYLKFQSEVSGTCGKERISDKL